MAVKFNPFTGQLQIDEKGSGGGSSYIDGEVQNFSALPQTVGSPAVDSAYLVREAEGAWLLSRKPAGIYIRTANTGVRASDWTYAGEFPDVFSDDNLVIYNGTDSTKNVKFDASAIATGTTRTITVPNANITLDDAGDSRTPTAHAASHAAGTKAQFSGQVSGMTEDVFIRADNAGTAGNSITLTFDGVDDIDTVLGAWNSANPSNQATLISGDGSQVPDNGEEITLSGGVAGGSDPITNARFDSLRINGSEVEFGGSLNQYNLPFKVRSQDASNVQIAQVLGFNGKGAAFYGTGGLSTDGPIVQATEYEVTNDVNFYVNAYGGNVIVGDTTNNGEKLQVGGNITLKDLDSNQTATFDAQGNLTANRTYDLPDASGTLALTSDIPANTIASTIVDAKGDLIVGTAADTVARLPVGATNGHVLTVDSAEAGGMKWAAASGGGVSAVNSTLADILSVSGSDLVADDLGADKLYGWDDSESKAIGFTTVGPTFDGTTLRWPVELVIACSDETTNLTTGTAKVTFRAPYAFTLTGVRASVNTAPTGSTLIVDINNGANSALSTKLSIDASEKTSTTAATAAVIDTSYDDISDDAEITIDIDQIGSTIAGKGLKVTLIGTRA